MEKELVAFRIDAKKKKALDEIGKSTNRGRSYILNEAVDNYLEVYQRQIESIKRGMAQLEAGDVLSQEEMDRFFDELLK